jgi:SprT protein
VALFTQRQVWRLTAAVKKNFAGQIFLFLNLSTLPAIKLINQQVSNTSIAEVLSKYIPSSAVPICTGWIVKFNIHLRITKNRASKFGDYRPARGSDGHIITVNHNLNQYSFLITFIHEVAHLICEKKHSRFVAPHGRQWKQEYAVLLKFFLSLKIFPSDIENALHHYVKDPAASSCTDENLLRALKKYDCSENEKVTFLEELPHGSVFMLNSSKKIFVKGVLMRKRFQCFEHASRIEYRVSALAEVTRMEQVAVAAGNQ